MTKKTRTVVVYHQLRAREGEIVSAAEARRRLRHGWVTTPERFGKGLRGKYYSFRNATRNLFWPYMIGLVVITLLVLQNCEF